MVELYDQFLTVTPKFAFQKKFNKEILYKSATPMKINRDSTARLKKNHIYGRKNYNGEQRKIKCSQ